MANTEPALDFSEFHGLNLFDEEGFNLEKRTTLSEPAIQNWASDDEEEEIVKEEETIQIGKISISVPDTSNNLFKPKERKPSVPNKEEDKIIDAVALKQTLEFVCKGAGIQYQENWYNYFCAKVLAGEEVKKKDLSIWIEAIKMERSTNAVVDLHERVADLTIQISKMAGLVASLHESQSSYAEMDKNIYVAIDSITKAEIAAKIDTGINKPVQDPTSAVHSSVNNSSAPQDKMKKKEVDQGIPSPTLTDEEELFLMRAFLEALGVDKSEIDNPIIKIATRALFNPQQMNIALQDGVTEEDADTAFAMIQSKIEELHKENDQASSSKKK